MKTIRILLAVVIAFTAGAIPTASPQPPLTLDTLHRFAAPLRAGRAPLVQAPDGTLFGIMESGGVKDMGGVFQLTPDGAGGFTFALLHMFNGVDGSRPVGLTYSAVDDTLYGTTIWGGVDGSIQDDMGTVFKLTRSGVLTTLIDFDMDFSDPQPLHPQASLFEARDGFFYGTAGGASTSPGGGAVFRMDRAGSYDVLHFFSGTDGRSPASTLVEGSDGLLYGTTMLGGSGDAGTVFRLERTGSNFQTLHHFTGSAATLPQGLVLDDSGGADVFYGLTGGGGVDNRGSVFTFTPSGTVTTVASLGPHPNPETPVGALVKAPDGRFYGTTESGMPGFLGGVFSFDPVSGDVAVAHDFNTNPGLGLITSAGLLRAADGTLLGTSHGGGAHSVGTVFRVDTSAPFPDVTKVADVPPLGPAHPSERMVRASDGHLYGTTSSGGAYGSGTIFRFANGVMTAIHDFDFVNGHLPSGELLQASDGYLYGTTTYGGNIQFTGDIGGGIVFRTSLTGAFSVVHAFSNYSVEGAHPLAGLVEGPDGNFYGTTHQAGPLGAGTVFKMTPSGVVTTLHAFSVWSATRGTLVLGEDGYFYGVTREGGSNPNGGTIYKIDSQGNFVLLHEFVNPDDGAHPTALTLGTDGNLYGVTEHGGVSHHGTLFRITPAGALTVLHRFDQTIDGEAPASAPVEAGDGTFYGTTWLSGTLGGFFSGLGTIYRYDSGGFSLLHTFGIPLAAADGTPFAGLTQGSNDRLFGATLIRGGGTLYSFEAGITNKAPVVQHQRVSIGPGGAANVTIPAVDPDGDAISFSIVGQPAHGTVTGSGPSFHYQPSSGFSGTDSFYVRVNDGTVSSAVAGVAITVGAPNAAPIAHDQSVSLSEDTATAITLTGSDPEGGALSFSLLTSPANGILTGTAPNLTFQATGHYHGSDSFTFKVTDNGSLDSNVATVSITIDSVNDAPVAFDQSFTSTNGAPVPLVLSANDADGDALSYNIIAPPASGVLSGGGANLTYTPNPGFAGADTFTWHANDGTADSNVATVTVTVPATTIATVTTLQLSTAAVGALQPVTLTATVTPAAGGGVPSGDVEFVIGATVFGVAPLQGGVAVLNTNASANGGTFAIAARYVGALPFTGSVSASATLTVRPLAESTYTFLFPWTNARTLGTPFTASAFVVPLSGGTAPAGTVEFFEGTSLVATATLSSGVATATWTPSATGTLAISARYLGSGTLAPSASHPALIAVYAGAAPASTTTTLAAGPSPATFGQPVTFTATVSANVPAGGLVTFFADGVVLGSAAVTDVGGVKRATLTTSALALGLKIVSASYAGAPGFAPSNAALISVMINP